MASRPASIFGIDRSLSGKAWRWRGGNMDLSDGPGPLDDVVTQLLLSRGVPREDLERHRTPSLRAFLPDPSQFRDMDAAAERLAQTVLTRSEGHTSELQSLMRISYSVFCLKTNIIIALIVPT